MRILYNHLCDACLPIGTLNREFYLFHGVNKNRLFTVPYAVDNEYFTSSANQYAARADAKEQLGLPVNKPLILFASKLIPRKRPMDVMRAFHRLRTLGVEASLIFVGSGEDEPALKNYVKQQQLTDVYFFGFRNQSELPRYYSVSDVFVFPSENEPWGLVLNEVMCSGLPVVVSQGVGAVPDLVRHGQNGFVYETADVEALSDYLFSILTDPKMRKQMGQTSREIIAGWDNERCVKGLKEALARIESDKCALAERQAA
jgi:glycosyltransferase involved in cell wall biosynthesis